MARRNFTQEEDEYIKAHYGTDSMQDIAEHLGKSVSGVRHRAARYGLTRRIRKWTDEEDEVIRSAVGRRLKDVATELGRGRSAVGDRARKLGIEHWCSDMRGYARQGSYQTTVVDGRHLTIHRAVMERHLGRRLKSTEIVHHIDLDKDNNELSNLHLFDSRAAHRWAHASLNAIPADIRERGAFRFDRTRGVYVICETEN